jgi:hypothetical protein
MMHKLLASVLLSASLVACITEPEDGRIVGESTDDRGFHWVKLLIADATGRPGTATHAQLEAELVSLIDSASRDIVFAVSRFDSTPVANAIVRARARGVTVRGAGDLDLQDGAGFAPVLAAGIPVTFGNGELFWNPQPGLDLIRSGEINQMFQNIVVVDVARFAMLSSGFLASDDQRTWIASFGSYEELGRDIRDIIEQLHGGLFATTLTGFDASLSTDTNNRTIYPTNAEAWEFYFGPGEPLMKQVIDEVYEARSSVWTASEQFAHATLADALIYKARAGFDVRVFVELGAEDGVGSQVARLEAEFDAVRPEGQAWPRVYRVANLPQATVLLDSEPSSIDGLLYPGSLMVLTQTFHSAGPFIANSTDTRASDIFTDASMFVIPANPARQQPNFDVGVRWFQGLVSEVAP